MTVSRRVITCHICKRQRRHNAKGLCSTCLPKWIKAGRPEDFSLVAPPTKTQIAHERAVVNARIETYRWFTRDMRMSQKEARALLGVAPSTAVSYEATLRDWENAQATT